MLPSQVLLLLCHLDNDLVTIINTYILIRYDVCVLTAHDLHLTWGHFFSHGTPVWPWPVITKKGTLPCTQENQETHQGELRPSEAACTASAARLCCAQQLRSNYQADNQAVTSVRTTRLLLRYYQADNQAGS